MSRHTTQAGPGSEFFTRTEFIQPPVAKESLVAWFPFRSGTGEDITAGDSNFGDTTDYSATVNGATFKPSGGVTDIETGANSGAFDFDGTDDFIRSNTQMPSDVTGNNPRTLMYFVRPERARTTADIHTGFGNPSNSEFFGAFHRDANGTARLTIFLFGVDFDTGKDLTLGTYQHIAITYDGSVVRIFVNGVETPTSGVSRSLSTRQSDIVIGNGIRLISGSFFDGSIDGLRVYDGALSQSQINQIYLNTEP